ncbi:MAG TPA: biotin--[acetyl-CoA-carboxylase] ligase [bacterium]|nr:biotin--[acetyl-CoA-carboxylase] ligase [bacterium]
MREDLAFAIKAGLRSHRFGQSLHVHAQVGSTNDEAATLAAQGVTEGTAVLAVEQIGARGRRQRAWLSPAGGLWLSVVLRPALLTDHWPLVGFAAGVGAARAVEEVAPVKVGLKWPNDLMIGERKLGGVLMEVRGSAVIVGIGINANIALDHFSPEVRSIATSLLAVLARPVDLAALARALLEQFERAYDLLPLNAEEVLAGWRERDLTQGRQVRLSGAEDLEGVAEGVDRTGALLVRTGAGIRRIVAGDVSLRSVSVPHR